MKTNLKVMHFISRLMENDAQPKPSKILPALRIFVCILCILLCALAKNAFFVVAVIAVELLRLALQTPNMIRQVLKPVLTAVFFTALFLLPAVFLGSPRTMSTVTLKVFESVLVLSMMNATMTWKEVTDAFRALHAPQIFVFVLDMAVRFLVILGRYSNAILEAVSLRSVGKTNWKTSQTGGILGTTFLKSQQMSQETSEAMACRCFDGEYKSYASRRFCTLDLIYLLLIPALIALFFYSEWMMK
ncbi:MULTISPECIES: energy-coupling factor transporter transmembrane component T [Caproicibacterium]|uniref:Energy-coupling factor transporter transmembrane protein EcfT n=2 Tax=Caproicibacterium lactatifermentans TaxID=2666138 RepID=A0A859DMS2_9FIRM|nr:energy-coupling factor transporter transmembrane component T [Caproicibacterium lactatifermentans]ARP50976.1 hypothetical protein B6259_08900 [Ruminococcaceae bacterium CPB6]MDD4808284.1 energy-coupling factor transporter transmembrane component T [Oscillospiraceae bacterium]QKN23297.1 hypothetical protein GJQ69_01600 [Caproicibacterium lactatifermentans]QKO30021.1 hypothetical protein GKP14_02750 [Caproicibacterium lactatifermentans]